MTPTAFPRRNRKIDWFFVCLMGGLFVFSVAVWLDLIPYDGFQPLRMVILSSALALQPISALLLGRSRRTAYGLLALSMLLLALSFLVRR